jgi:hypothetical protein
MLDFMQNRPDAGRPDSASVATVIRWWDPLKMRGVGQSESSMAVV